MVCALSMSHENAKCFKKDLIQPTILKNSIASNLEVSVLFPLFTDRQYCLQFMLAKNVHKLSDFTLVDIMTLQNVPKH